MLWTPQPTANDELEPGCISHWSPDGLDMASAEAPPVGLGSSGPVVPDVMPARRLRGRRGHPERREAGADRSAQRFRRQLVAVALSEQFQQLAVRVADE
jgi:hypothetical protein